MESRSEIKHKKVERQEEGKKGGGIVLECVMRVDPVKWTEHSRKLCKPREPSSVCPSWHFWFRQIFFFFLSFPRCKVFFSAASGLLSAKTKAGEKKLRRESDRETRKANKCCAADSRGSSERVSSYRVPRPQQPFLPGRFKKGKEKRTKAPAPLFLRPATIRSSALTSACVSKRAYKDAAGVWCFSPCPQRHGLKMMQPGA